MNISSQRPNETNAGYLERVKQTIMDSTDAHRSDMEKLKRSNARLRSALQAIHGEHCATSYEVQDIGWSDGLYLKPSLLELVKLALEDVDK